MSKPARRRLCAFTWTRTCSAWPKLVGIRGDVTYPGDPGGPVRGGRHRLPCPIATDTPDARWIPGTAERQWLIITRDRHIQEHWAEIEAVRASGARMVVLGGDEALGTFHQLEVLMCQWRRIEALLGEPGRSVEPSIATARDPSRAGKCGQGLCYAARPWSGTCRLLHEGAHEVIEIGRCFEREVCLVQ